MYLPAKDWQGALFLSPSHVYVRSFLYLLYTLIKPYYTKKKDVIHVPYDCPLNMYSSPVLICSQSFVQP